MRGKTILRLIKLDKLAADIGNFATASAKRKGGCLALAQQGIQWTKAPAIKASLNWSQVRSVCSTHSVVFVAHWTRRANTVSNSVSARAYIFSFTTQSQTSSRCR